MLKIISTKNEADAYNRAKKEKTNEFGFFLECMLDEAKTNAENISIFGDVNAFFIKMNIGNRGVINEDELKYLNQDLFLSLQNSPHFFILNGYGAEFDKLCVELTRGGTVQFIKIEEKKVNDFPAELVTALQKHDKKNSWFLMLNELNKKDAEPIHGTCVFAYKSLLVYLNDTKQNSPNSGVKEFSWSQAKRNAVSGKRERQEVQDKYFNLILNYHLARQGELNLEKQLEKWVLEN